LNNQEGLVVFLEQPTDFQSIVIELYLRLYLQLRPALIQPHRPDNYSQ